MNNYEYYMTMKNIAEDQGREKPELRKIFSEAAKQFEEKAKSIEVIEEVTDEQKNILAFHGVFI